MKWKRSTNHIPAADRLPGYKRGAGYGVFTIKAFPIFIIILVTLTVILLLAGKPVYDSHQCQDPGRYKWQYGRDVCLKVQR